MDSLTHLVAGALVPIAFPRTPKRAALVTFGIIAGEMPDIDTFFSFGTVEGLLTIHRGITHSIFLQPLLLLVFLIPFWFLFRQGKKNFPANERSKYNSDGLSSGQRRQPDALSFSNLALMGLFALYIHLYLDSMTTFGTQIFLPLSTMRVALPSMFIVDLALLVPALLLLIVALFQVPVLHTPVADDADDEDLPAPRATFFSQKAHTLARLGICWILLYPLLCLGINQGATWYFAATLRVPKSNILLITEAFSPLLWKLVHDRGDTYESDTVSLFSPKQSALPVYQKADQELLSKLAEQQPLFDDFKKFCPTMIQYMAPSSEVPGATRYSFADIRYVPSAHSPLRWVNRTKTLFIMEALVTEAGGFLAYRFLDSDEEANETPWISTTNTSYAVNTD